MNFSIVTGCSPGYEDKLRYTIPTWAYKPQFKGKKLYIFYSGVKVDDLLFVKDYFPDTEFIPWAMSTFANTRELMLSSFILGVDHIKSDWFVKLDADTVFLNKDDVFDESDLLYDLVSHPWSYTKPGWWIDVLDNWYTGSNKLIDPTKKISSQSRIISWCCLHKTEFVKEISTRAGSRLPVPSHDTYAWYMAEKLEHRKWRVKNLKRRGVDHCSRWKSIREIICSHSSSDNPFMNNILLDHVQLEVTTHCQLGCYNCDRNCGIAKSDEHMSLDQIRKFVVESIDLNKKWGRVDIIGGEPTYYPDLKDLFSILYAYKEFNPGTQIRFSTNGLGTEVKKNLALVPNWVTIRNSEKINKSNNFESYNDAPIDHGLKDSPPCSIPWRCGIGLTRYGYFPCGAGAAIARVFGIDIGINSLYTVKPELLKAQMKELCKYCGHSNTKFKHLTNKAELSKSWELAIKDYKDRKLGLY